MAEFGRIIAGAEEERGRLEVAFTEGNCSAVCGYAQLCGILCDGALGNLCEFDVDADANEEEEGEDNDG